MLSKSLIEFSVDGWSCVPSLLFDLRPIYGEVNEDNGNLLQKVACTHCCTQCLQPCSRPPLNHTSSQRLLDTHRKSGSVSFGITAPFSWVPEHTRFCLCPPRVYFPVLCKFWQLYVSLMVTSSKRAYAIPRSAAPEPPPLWQTTADPYLHRRHSNTVLSQSLWGLWVLVLTRFV